MRNPFFRRPRVFISYRRSSGGAYANLIYGRLWWVGVDAFRDTRNIHSGQFADILTEQITQRHNFIAILTPDTLESAWVVREIALALKKKHNIIPVEVGGFKLSTAELPPEIANLRTYTAIEFDTVYENPSIARIKKALQPSLRMWLTSVATAVGVFMGVVGLVGLLTLSMLGNNREASGPSATSQMVAAGPTLTPSATLNPTEAISTEAATRVTATAYVEAVNTQIFEIYTQQAARDFVFQTQTATYLPTTEGDSSGGGGSGEIFTPSATMTPSLTPDVSTMAAATVDARNTTTMEAWLGFTGTPQSGPPHRVTLTPTATMLIAAPIPGNQQPEATRGSSSAGSTPTRTPLATATVSTTPTPTASVSFTPTNLAETPTPSATAPTMPPTSDYFALPTPAIISNPSFVVIPVYAGPSESSVIVAFLNHADTVHIYAELTDRGWVFIGSGWVRFNRVLPVGDDANIPIFQTQVAGFAPEATTEDDFRALGYQMMTLRAGDGGISGRGGNDATSQTRTPTPGLNISQYQTFVAGLTLTTMPTRAPTSTPSLTRTAAVTSSRTPQPTATRTLLPTSTRTPLPTTTPAAGGMEVFNPARYGCVTSSQTINVREQPTTDSVIVGHYASGSVMTVNGQQNGWYWIGGGWIFGELLSIHSSQAAAQAVCVSVPPPATTNPNNPPPTSGPPPTPGPSPTPEPFSIEIINLNTGIYGEINNDQGEPQGCRANFVVHVRGVTSISAQVYADNDSYADPGNLEQTVTLYMGDNPLGATLGGNQSYRGHTINIITSLGNASAGASCRDS